MSDAADTALNLTDQDVSDAFIYLLGRLLITNQQQADFDHEGLVWNELIHRKPGQVDWPNPNLDVAYSEAWVALDEASYLLVTVPPVPGRYYVVEFLDGWGETVANLNDRVYPDHPHGLFALCLAGAKVAIPAGAKRVDVPTRTMRVLLRVELGANWDEAIALQKQFKFEIHGNPPWPEIPRTVTFDIENLPGVEAFDFTETALQEKDSGTNMGALAANARQIARAIGDPATRARIDKVVREKAHRDFAIGASHIGHGTVRDGWVRPAVCGHWGNDWLARAAVNYGGIWANVMEEVIYYKGLKDGEGADIEAGQSYTLTFPAGDLPSKYAKYFWSVIAVDRVHRRVLPNPLNRFLLNKESKLSYGDDGSLTLYLAPEKPGDAPEGNWLPTKDKPWSLTFRFYGPRGAVADGSWFPPPLIKQ